MIVLYLIVGLATGAAYKETGYEFLNIISLISMILAITEAIEYA